MEAENIDISKGYCKYLTTHCLSGVDSCPGGDPKDYETCHIYDRLNKEEKKWENRIPEIRERRF